VEITCQITLELAAVRLQILCSLDVYPVNRLWKMSLFGSSLCMICCQVDVLSVIVQLYT